VVFRATCQPQGGGIGIFSSESALDELQRRLRSSGTRQAPWLPALYALRLPLPYPPDRAAGACERPGLPPFIRVQCDL